MTSSYEGQPGSINEPPGSKVIPDGTGQGTGEGQKTLRLDALSPNRLPVGPTSDFVLTATGLGFDASCIIVFNGEELPTTFRTGLTARPPMAQQPIMVAVRVKKKEEYSNKIEFEFADPDDQRGGDDERDPHDHRGGSDRNEDQRGYSRNRPR